MRYKKLVLFGILLCSLIVSACAPKTQTLSGESDNWKIHYNYEVNKKTDCTAETNGAIKYIGENPIPKVFEYTISNSSGQVSLNDDQVFNLPNGCTNASEDIIEATIVWDNKTEKIKLGK